MVTIQDKPQSIAKVGRPTILTPAIIQGIATLIRKGNYVETACKIVGVSDTALYEWRRKGEEDATSGLDSIYKDFACALKEADAAQEAEMVERVRTAALPGPKSKKTIKKIGPDGTSISEEVLESGGDWLAAATFLERRNRERWGRPAPIQITNEDNRQQIIEHVEVVLSKPGDMPRIGEKSD